MKTMVLTASVVYNTRLRGSAWAQLGSLIFLCRSGKYVSPRVPLLHTERLADPDEWHCNDTGLAPMAIVAAIYILSQRAGQKKYGKHDPVQAR